MSPRDPFRIPGQKTDPPVEYPSPEALAWRRRLQAITAQDTIRASQHLALAPTQRDAWPALARLGELLLKQEANPDWQSIGRRLQAISRDALKVIDRETGAKE